MYAGLVLGTGGLLGLGCVFPPSTIPLEVSPSSGKYGALGLNTKALYEEWESAMLLPSPSSLRLSSENGETERFSMPLGPGVSSLGFNSYAFSSLRFGSASFLNLVCRSIISAVVKSEPCTSVSSGGADSQGREELFPRHLSSVSLASPSSPSFSRFCSSRFSLELAALISVFESSARSNSDRGGASPKPMFLSWYTSDMVGVSSPLMCLTCAMESRLLVPIFGRGALFDVDGWVSVFSSSVLLGCAAARS